MGPEALSINATFVGAILTHRATVYGRTSGTGPFNAVLLSAVACRLDEVGRNPSATGTQRRELANLGTFRWDATVDIPETGIQIEVDAFPGVRWNPTLGTRWPDDLPGIGVVGRTMEVTRAL